MEISFSGINLKKTTRSNKSTDEKTPEHKSYQQQAPKVSKLKTSALIAMFLLPTLGTVSCSSGSRNDGQETVEAFAEKNDNSKYLNISDSTFYTVKSGDNPEAIARKHNVSTRRLLAANGLTRKSIIHPNDNLIIPQAYTVKEIQTLDDVAKMSGIYKNYLEDLQNFETKHDSIYKDRNNNKTIGIGHLVTPDELSNFKGKTLTDAEIYTILAQDLLDVDLDLQTVINEKAYKNMPVAVKESVIDLAFNKGVGAVSGNEALSEALNNEQWAKAISHLTQDYSVVTNAKGQKVKKQASGLSKRRLYDMANAARIYKKGMPEEILNSAKEVYARGLKYLQEEKARGEISTQAYPNVLAEYKNLAHEWFGGKLGEKSDAAPSGQKTATEATTPKPASSAVSPSTTKDHSSQIYVNGQKTNWTEQALYADWQKTATRKLRYVKRPMPEVDKNGNIVATVRTLDPKGKGKLSGRTILINPGHGGAMNNVEKNGSLNVNFDPGTSNAVMSKKNPNIETNVFKGNGGKSLEEWVVNQRIADELVEKIRKEGGKVIYVQGSVYSAQTAIREIQNKQKIDMIVSLHSNSDGAKRGIYIIGNNRGGIDKKDKELGKMITDKLNEHSWFRGITKQTSKSLGVLSSSPKATSPVPGVLIETGNLKNEKDVANLNSRTFKTQLVESIFESIKNYKY